MSEARSKKSLPPSHFFSLTFYFLLLFGCAGPLKQFTYESSELSRSADFSSQSLLSHKVGILTTTGEESYRLIIGDALAKAFNKVEPRVKLVHPHEAMSLINQADLSRDYSQMLRDYQTSGILHKETLKRVSQALDIRYLILPNLLDYRRDTSTRVSLMGVRFVQTRSSTLRVFAQIWDGETGRIAWEGTAEVTLAGEDIREKPIPFEEVALLAWKELVKKLR